MDQFEQDMENIEQGDFVKISYDHSTNDKRIEISGVIAEIVDADEFPSVTIRCGGGRHLRLTWNRNLGGKFGVEKIAFQESILGNKGEIELLHKSV